MSAKAIREATGKKILNNALKGLPVYAPSRFASIDASTDWNTLIRQEPWLETSKLVVKPDQLIKRRGKLGLIKVDADLAAVKQWIAERLEKDIQV